MRWPSLLCFFLFVLGCSAPPVDLGIPEDHPASPRAGASPSRIASDYLYQLPAHPQLPEKADPLKAKDQSHPMASEHEAEGTEAMTSGGAHAH